MFHCWHDGPFGLEWQRAVGFEQARFRIPAIPPCPIQDACSPAIGSYKRVYLTIHFVRSAKPHALATPLCGKPGCLRRRWLASFTEVIRNLVFEPMSSWQEADPHARASEGGKRHTQGHLTCRTHQAAPRRPQSEAPCGPAGGSDQGERTTSFCLKI